MSASDRVHLARENVGLVALALARFHADGADVDEVAVLLLDVRDPLARDLTSAIVERSSDLDLDAEVSRLLQRHEIPTAIAVVPLRAAEELLAQTHPSVRSALSKVPGAGRARVIIVAAGGATLLHLPVEPRPPAGSA